MYPETRCRNGALSREEAEQWPPNFQSHNCFPRVQPIRLEPCRSPPDSLSSLARELPMDFFSRREFLERSAILSAAAAASATASAHPPTPSPSPPRGQADRLRVAVVGVHGRGMSHVGGFLGKNNCEITTICDCDEAVIGKAMKTVEKAQGKAPKYEKDIRKVVDDKNIDIISIATPNHWHALAAIWAMQNGKDVYVEKPVSHNVSEGRRSSSRPPASTTGSARPARRAAATPACARRSPSSTAASSARSIWPAACATSRAASIGKVGRTGTQKPPTTMDYDLWCGPAPLKPPHRNDRATAPSTTTGTGSGTTATATSATRASTRWTRPAGASARTTMPNSGRQRRRPLRLHRRRRDRQHAALRLRLRRLRS